MAELLGAVLAIAGPLNETLRLLEELKMRSDAVGAHLAQADGLHKTFTRLSNDLKALHGADVRRLSDAQKLLIDGHLQDLTGVVKSALSRVRHKCERSKSMFYRFARATKNAVEFANLDEISYKCASITIQLTCLLAVVDAPAGGRPPADHAQRQTPTSTPGEKFRPSFSVERNDKLVAMDFSTIEDGAFVTVEGRLKAMVLGSAGTVGAVAGGAVGTVATGVGGVGKTCALRALAQEADVKARFPGGIYFRSLGRDAELGDVVQMLADFVELSGGPRVASEIKLQNVPSATAKACAWFADQTCLFIVDDVWKSNDMPHDIMRLLSPLVEAGNERGDGSRIVYSTRDRQLAAAACGAVVEFRHREVRGTQARAMLLDAAQMSDDISSVDRIDEHVVTILDYCGGLPFTLNIAGRLVHEVRHGWCGGDADTAWTECAEMFHHSSEKLLNNDQESYFSSLDISLNFLDEKRALDGMTYREAIEALCVLRRQDWVPISTLRHIFGAEDVAATERIVQNLWAFGIVDREMRVVHARNMHGIRIHDHVHTYATWLSRVHGREECWYSSAVQSLELSLCDNGEALWPVSVKDDGYIVQNVTRFLLKGGDVDLAGDVLRSARWVTKIMSLGYVLQYEHDVQLFKASCTEDGDSKELEKLCKIVRFSHPDCVGHTRAAWFQLYARLSATGNEEPWMQSIVDEAERYAPRPFFRPIAPCLQYPSDALAEFYPSEVSWTAATFSASGDVLIAGYGGEIDANSKMIFSSVRNGSKISETRFATGGVPGNEVPYCICVSPSAPVLVIGYRSGALRVWCTDTGRLNGTLLGHDDVVMSVSIGDEGRTVVSGSVDKSLRAWDLGTMKPLWCQEGAHNGPVASVCLSADGSRAVSGSFNRSVRVWDVATGQEVGAQLNVHAKRIRVVSISADGALVLAGSTDKKLRVWDVATRQQKCRPLVGHNALIRCAAFSRDGRFVVSGSSDKTVRVWDVSSGAQAGAPLVGHAAFVSHVQISADNTHVVSSSIDRTVRVWDVRDGRTRTAAQLTGHYSWVTSISACADGSRVASGSSDRTARVWDVRTGRPVTPGVLAWHSAWVSSVSLSADGSRVASGSGDGKVRVWDMERAAFVGEPQKALTESRRSVALSGDGSRVAAGCDDLVVRVWDVDSGDLVCGPDFRHKDLITSVALNSAGSVALSQSQDGVLRVWDVESGQCLGSAQNEGSGRDGAFDEACRTHLGGVPAQPTRGPGTVWKDERMVMAHLGIFGEQCVAVFDRPINELEQCICDGQRYVIAGLASGVMAFLRIDE